MPSGSSDLSPNFDIGRPDLFLNKCSRTQLAAHPPLEGRSDNPDVSGVQGMHCARGVAVDGLSLEGTGVHGDGEQTGVMGESQKGNGVVGKSQTGHGVFATSRTGEAVRCETNSRFVAAVVGVALNPNLGPNGEFSSGVWGISKAGEGPWPASH